MILKCVTAKVIELECDETKADQKTSSCTLQHLQTDSDTQFRFKTPKVTWWWFIKEDMDFEWYSELRVVNSKTKAIPRIFFRQYPNLQTLSMNGTGLEEWHPLTFMHARRLRTLTIPYNELQALPRFAFYGARVLETIDLEFNKLNTVDSHAFIDLQALRVIKLRGNQLKTLSLEFISNDKLRLLDVSENYLQKLQLTADANFETHLTTELKILAGFNEIADLHIQDTFPVTSLFLQHNQLTGMNTVINLKSLRFLNIESNPLGALPLTTFFTLGKLEYLNVNDALMTSLNSALFARLTKLKHLDISNNNFTTIDWNMLAACSELEELAVFEHQLSQADAEHLATIFPHLKRVWISGSAWDCEDFDKIAESLKDKGVQVNEGLGEYETVSYPRGVICVPTLFL